MQYSGKNGVSSHSLFVMNSTCSNNAENQNHVAQQSLASFSQCVWGIVQNQGNLKGVQ